MNERPSLDSVWIKAAILGGFWASFEIIAGSFFHNLRIPFSGTILAAIGVVIMVAFFQMWPEKGLIWRAGLICALMKSISPSAVILGPMIGIFMEALIIQFFIWLFGNNLFALLLGGALSVASALLHKIVSLLILYGFKIIVVYDNIIRFVSRQVNIENLDLVQLIIVLLAGYIILGFSAVLIGYRIGRRTVSSSHAQQQQTKLPKDTRNIFSIDPAQQYSIWILLLLLMNIPVGLFLINQHLLYAGIYLFLIILICIFNYRHSLKRLRKPTFWIQLVLIILLSAIFWQGKKIEWPLLDREGLKVGMEMILRAVFIIMCFSAISIELRNPVIKDFLFNRGFSKIYIALELAFSSLPLMIDALPEAKFFLRHPIKSFSLMMTQAQGWLTAFEKELQP